MGPTSKRYTRYKEMTSREKKRFLPAKGRMYFEKENIWSAEGTKRREIFGEGKYLVSRGEKPRRKMRKIFGEGKYLAIRKEEI